MDNFRYGGLIFLEEDFSFQQGGKETVKDG